MALIVSIHGIGQQLKGEDVLALEWRAALRDGMRRAGAREEELPRDEAVKVAFYGDLFRGKKAGGDEPFEWVDVKEDGLEADLLKAWSNAADLAGSQTESGIELPPTKAGRAPQSVQRLAEALLRVPFFAKLTDRLLVGALRQVRWYLTDRKIRDPARERLSRLLGPETRLVVAHSLGSIVAYEVLCSAADSIAPALVTLGSPLGLPNLIFDRLDPCPVDGKGSWPGHTTSWTNIADRGDIVASVKKLAPLFGECHATGERVRDVCVDNEALAHDIGPYFTAPGTGKAVLEAIRAA